MFTTASYDLMKTVKGVALQSDIICNKTNWLASHRAVASILTGLAILPLFLLLKNLGWQVSFFVLNVLLSGVSHGSLDHLKCPPDSKGNVTVVRMATFFAVYLGLVGLIISIWLTAPGFMLLVFLLVSCFHFAVDEDSNLSVAQKFLWGTLPIAAPCAFHTDEVLQLFGFLASSQPQVILYICFFFKLVGLLLTALVLTSLISQSRSAFSDHNNRKLSENIVMTPFLLAYILLSPLLSFTLYFCWWHSARQNIKLVADMDCANFKLSALAFLRYATPLTLGSWLIGLFVYFWLSNNSFSQVDEQLIKTVFYVLSALTVPHILVSFISPEYSSKQIYVTD